LSSFWLTLKQQWTIKISSPLFSIFSLAAILVGSRDHRTQFWKGAIQGPFHQSLVQIGPVASEELIKMWKVNGRTDGRSVVTIAHLTLWVRWAKNQISYLFSLFVLHFVSFILLPMNSVILSNLMYMYTDCTFLIDFIIDKNITKKKT
jgi:hypothetical protein